MAGPRIVVQVDSVRLLGTSLKSIGAEFEGANTNSANIAAAVGHGGLAQVVRDFSKKWDESRKKMTEAVKSLGDAAAAVADAWVDIDQQGADLLRGQDE
ncbi:MAG: hypothetical protein LBO75_00580 [Bifidobacteriaceae bacterium]|nr:hypothetical protein [Bifidobacteriaceae bacterium]